MRWPTEPIRPSYLISRWMSSPGRRTGSAGSKAPSLFSPKRRRTRLTVAGDTPVAAAICLPVQRCRRSRSISLNGPRQTPTASATASGVYPLVTCRTVRSRPRGVSRAFLCTFLRFFFGIRSFSNLGFLGQSRMDNLLKVGRSDRPRSMPSKHASSCHPIRSICSSPRDTTCSSLMACSANSSIP